MNGVYQILVEYSYTNNGATRTAGRGKGAAQLACSQVRHGTRPQNAGFPDRKPPRLEISPLDKLRRKARSPSVSGAIACQRPPSRLALSFHEHSSSLEINRLVREAPLSHASRSLRQSWLISSRRTLL